MSQYSQFWLCLFLHSFQVVIAFLSVQCRAAGEELDTGQIQPTPQLLLTLQAGSTHPTAIAGPDFTQKSRAETPGRLRSPLASALLSTKDTQGQEEHQILPAGGLRPQGKSVQ